MKKLLLLTGFLLLAVNFTAAQQTTSPTTTAKTAKVKTAKTQKMMPTDDAGITTCINEKLAKSKMSGEGFQVSVSGAAATFTGSTKVPGRKGGVSGMAKSCGAKSIVNNITVEGKPTVPKKPKTKAATNSTGAPKSN